MSTIKEWLKVINNQTKVIFAILIFVAIIPNVIPISLPIIITQPTQDFYDTIKNLPEGSTVMVGHGYSSGNWGELGGGVIAVHNQLIQLGDKHFKVILTPLESIDGALLIQRVLGLQIGGKDALGKYGVDWVFLGYVPGQETAYANMLSEPDGMHTTWGNKDYYGTDMKNLPIMDNILDHRDIDLFIYMTAAGPMHAVRQFGVPYQIPILSVDIGVDWPEAKMAYDNRALKGALKSTVAASEYEKLLSLPGLASSTVGGLSFNHLLIIGFIILGNIQYFLGRRKKEGGK